MPPPVLYELLSAKNITHNIERLLVELPRLEIEPGYWERAGALRRKILKNGLRARSMDCLIAQNCIDHNVNLIASGTDFSHYTRYGLRLIK